jgi:hypothetical protein
VIPLQDGAGEHGLEEAVVGNERTILALPIRLVRTPAVHQSLSDDVLPDELKQKTFDSLSSR